VHVEIRDVAEVIANAPAGAFDLILLDLYEGPNTATQSADDPFYSDAALARTHRALAPGGVAGIWSEDADAPFFRRFGGARFSATKHSIGSGGRRHVVYLGRRR
jgi:spermidine synthase